MAKVLLVDDNGSVLLTLAIALRRHGHTVTLAVDGDVALRELQTDYFEALVSDVRMPGLMGPELAIQARALHPDLRIILTSAYPSVESTAGVEVFLRKPIDIEQLHKVLSTLPTDAGRSQDNARTVHRETLPRSNPRDSRSRSPQFRAAHP